MCSSDSQELLGKTLVDFSTEGKFPHDEIKYSLFMNPSAYSGALVALSTLKTEVETEISSISLEIADEVDDWMTHNKSIQEGINQCHKLAHDIVHHAEDDKQRLEEIQDKEMHLHALQKENTFSTDLLLFYRSLMKLYHEFLLVEKSVAAKDFLNGLLKLEDIYKSSQHIFENRYIQIVRQIEQKYFELRKIIREGLLNLWENLVNVDRKDKTIAIFESLPNEMNWLKDVVFCLELLGELTNVTKKLCNDIDFLILQPRITMKTKKLPSIQITGCTISLGPMADKLIKALFLDIKKLLQFLAQILPVEVYQPLSESLMLILSDRILREWLDHSVPTCILDVIDYQKTLTEVGESIVDIESIGLLGFDGIRDWIENFPKIWLNKRRDKALEWTRNQIFKRVETSIKKEKVDLWIPELDQSGSINPVNATKRQDWDAAWDFDEDFSVQTSDIKDHEMSRIIKDTNLSDESASRDHSENEDDDMVDAWGWAEENAQEPVVNKEIKKEKTKLPENADLKTSLRHINPSNMEEKSIFEEYWISELPKSIEAVIIEVYEDCATLSFNQESPVFSAILGLLTLPTHILAMYRAISPSYYTRDACGNMFRYNDSIWLAEKLREYTKGWKQRSDISSRYQNMDKSNADIVMLEKFGKRAITDEKIDQMATISSLLGGTQNLFSQENLIKTYADEKISAALSHVLEQSILWENILNFSTRASVMGAMANTLAEKIINDVFSLGDISVEDAEKIAAIISKIETLDNLFIPELDQSVKDERLDPNKVPLTAKFSDKWIKMKFLSEVLQSNLKDIKFLWFESDLSFYFSVEETVELIRLSFVMNAGVRQTIKEIRDNPNPKNEDL